MKYKCKCGKTKEFASVRVMVVECQKVSSAICDCGLGMEHIPDENLEFPSAGVHKGSSNF